MSPKSWLMYLLLFVFVVLAQSAPKNNAKCHCSCLHGTCECTCGNLITKIMEPGYLDAELNARMPKTKPMDLEHLHGKKKHNIQKNHFSEAAICNLVLSEVYKINNLRHEQFYDEARALFKREIKNEADIKESSTQLKRCQYFLKEELRRIHLPARLIDECPESTIPYNLLLCQYDFPEDLYEQLPSSFCKSSCHLIHLWNFYHTSRGQNEFPEGWNQQVNTNVHSDTSPNSGCSESDGNGGECYTEEYLMRYKRQGNIHGVLPVRPPKRFVQEFIETNTFSVGNWTTQTKCRDDEWPYAITDAFPFGVTLHCKGPAGNGLDQTLGNMTIGTVKPTLFNCEDHIEFKPPNGTYLIGLSNRIVYYPFDAIVAGVYLCSGELKWSKVKTDSEFDVTNGTGEIVRCPLGSIICTLEAKTIRMEDKDFMTDLRVGCCEAPDDMKLSSMILTPMEPLDMSGLEYGNATGAVLPQLYPSLPSEETWVRDYYTPFGSFIDAASATKLEIYGIGDLHSFFGTNVLFAYNNFKKNGEGVWTEQDPFPVRQEVTTTEDIKCHKGFFNGVAFNLISLHNNAFQFGMRCSDNNSWIFEHSRFIDPNDLPAYMFRCPQMNLLCGVRRSIPYVESLNSHVTTFTNYHLTYICCPVLHTGRSICGEEDGVVLGIVPAKVDCISVSGADTKCTTTQSYGFKSGTEMEEGATTDLSTESSYGYTSALRWGVVASVSGTVGTKATVKGGIPGFAKVGGEASASVTIGAEVSGGGEMTTTSSTTDRLSEGFSFSTAMTSERSNETTTETEYTIYDGQRAIFYDVQKICGTSDIVSEDFIRILTPSLKCDAVESYEYIFGWSTSTHGYDEEKQFTFRGFGLEIAQDTFVSPLERGVNWDLISLGVREKFTESVVLADENRFDQGGYDFKRAPAGLWRRSTYAIAYNNTFALNIFGTNYRFYRLVGLCGRWRVLTSSIWFQYGPEETYTYLAAPPDPRIHMERGYNFTVLP